MAVDSYCWLHRGAYSCSVELVEGIPTDKFVTSFMKRAFMLRRVGVEALFVFDGGRMPGKANEEADRGRNRLEAKTRARKHARAGNTTAANEQYQRAVDVSPEMALAVIHELKKNGFECIVAPYEADAQMAYLIRNDFVHGIVTEDSDMIPHKCASVFFKMDNDGIGQEIRYDDIQKNKDLSFVGFTSDQFLEMCVMSGCDYLPSLPGVGIKKAHALMRRLKTHATALRSLRFEGTSVSKKYEAGFLDALNVFRHQWVFCPLRREMVFLSNAPPPPRKDGGDKNTETSFEEETLESSPMTESDITRLLGVKHGVESACGVADGVLHPMTLQPYRALPTNGAPRDSSKPEGHTPSVARFFDATNGAGVSKKERPRSANDTIGVVDTGVSRGEQGLRVDISAGRVSSVHDGTTTPTADFFGVARDSLKVNSDPLREKERWVTPPDHTVGNPGKRAFYALLRASPMKQQGLGDVKKKRAKSGENGRHDDDAVNEAEREILEALERPSPAKPHPFHLPATASRYFSAPAAVSRVSTVPEQVRMPNRTKTPVKTHLSEDTTTAPSPHTKSFGSFAFAPVETKENTPVKVSPKPEAKPLFENFAFGGK